MSEFDHDLQSIQEARDLASRAFSAWKQWSTASQEQVDRVCAAMAAAAQAASERLGAEAHQETGFGVAEHKHLKNIFASKTFGKVSRTSKPLESSGTTLKKDL